MRALTLIVVGLGALAGIVGGCEQGNAGGESQSDRAQHAFTVLALETPDTPVGFVDFFMGATVASEFSETGTFTPSASKSYSMIRLPKEAVTRAEMESTPIVIPICDASTGIVLYDQRVGKEFRNIEGINCTPWVQEQEGVRTVRLAAGMTGLGGHVMVGRGPNGVVAAGAVVGGSLPSPCGPGSGLTDTAMVLGYLFDASPSDPLAASCN